MNDTPSRRAAVGLVVLVFVAAAALAMFVARRPRSATTPSSPDVAASSAVPGTVARDPQTPQAALRERLYAELQPVRLANCTLERIGEPRDGGYLMCANLMQAEVGYSYGISGYDGWGCRVSTRLRVPVHQYDCFDLRRTQCDGGDMRFHPECIAGAARTDADGRPFDSFTNQLARNGDAGRRLLVKMDVEGAEWDSLLATPASVLERIDQLVIELHTNNRDASKQLQVVSRLKEQFHVAHLHFNNFGCRAGLEPFPSYAWEVLLVNKRVGVAATDQRPIERPDPLDAPNDPKAPDCQYVPHP